MPFFRRRQQALGKERDLLGEDGQLAGLGVAQPAVDSDQVSQVEQFDQAPAFVADLLLADEDLDPFGPVAKVEEIDLPLAAAEHDPPGDANSRPGGLAARAQPAEAAKRGPRRWPDARRIARPRGRFPGRRFARASPGAPLRGSRAALRPSFPYFTSSRTVTSGEQDPKLYGSGGFGQRQVESVRERSHERRTQCHLVPMLRVGTSPVPLRGALGDDIRTLPSSALRFPLVPMQPVATLSRSAASLTQIGASYFRPAT